MHVATLDQQDRARRSGLGLTLCFREMTASGITVTSGQVTCSDCRAALGLIEKRAGR